MTLNNLIDAVLNKSDKCLFCGAKKTWNTDITISVEGQQKVTVTVCPDDRKKHSIYDLLEENINVSYNEVKKYIDELIEGDLLHE